MKYQNEAFIMELSHLRARLDDSNMAEEDRRFICTLINQYALSLTSMEFYFTHVLNQKSEDSHVG